MTAYLDYNIYTSMSEGEYSFQRISDLGLGISQCFYSASHIQEADNIQAENATKRDYLIAKRLKTISEISQNSYLYHELSTAQMQRLTEAPEVVLETIREFPFAQSAMRGFMNIASSEQKQQFRDWLGVDIKLLNNYQPHEVIAQLNSHLSFAGSEHSFIGMIEAAMALYPKDGTYGLHNRMAAIYELLDSMGYWKDKETSTSNYARLWDSSHAYHASFCDYFISDDKRNRFKAKVVYGIYKIPTKVISSNGQ